jgi:hypothetical protein
MLRVQGAFVLPSRGNSVRKRRRQPVINESPCSASLKAPGRESPLCLLAVAAKPRGGLRSKHSLRITVCPALGGLGRCAGGKADEGGKLDVYRPRMAAALKHV